MQCPRLVHWHSLHDCLNTAITILECGPSACGIVEQRGVQMQGCDSSSGVRGSSGCCTNCATPYRWSDEISLAACFGGMGVTTQAVKEIVSYVPVIVGSRAHCRVGSGTDVKIGSLLQFRAAAHPYVKVARGSSAARRLIAASLDPAVGAYENVGVERALNLYPA